MRPAVAALQALGATDGHEGAGVAMTGRRGRRGGAAREEEEQARIDAALSSTFFFSNGGFLNRPRFLARRFYKKGEKQSKNKN